MLILVFSAQLYSPPTFSLPEDDLIRDMESLRNSLPFKDAGRPQLTRRLADLYFQKAVDEEKNLLLKGEGDAVKIKSLRDSARKFYQDSLDGEAGVFPAATAELKDKIHFQVARLLRMEGASTKALAIFKEVSSSATAGKDLRREALLTVAEMLDEVGAWKDALSFYRLALPLCEGGEGKNYVHYRISWALYRLGSFKEAQEEIAKSLWDSQGVAKEQVIADYLQFLAQTPKTTGQEELTKIEFLVSKTGKPQLFESLADALFAAANREAGVFVMSYAHRQRPHLLLSARLAEEYYGFRRWEDFRLELTQFQKLKPQLNSLTAKQSQALDQILRRLVVQIDSERKSNTGSFIPESLALIDLHLDLFPNSDVVQKMRDGWIAAQTDDALKVGRLKMWAQQSQKLGKREEVKRYNLELASLAAKMKDFQFLKSVARDLAELETDKDKKREWNYIEAKAVLDSGREDLALDLFTKISLLPQNEFPDKWAILSQNLALSLLNKQKRYRELVELSSSWTQNSLLNSNLSLKDEMSSMEKIEQEARFENAISLGESPEALNTFMNYCKQEIFKDKACANARVLAIKLKQQDSLLSILKMMGDENALALELERSGNFAEAASIYEKKLSSTSDINSWLKVATFYQIADLRDSQQRVLRNLMKEFKKSKKIDPKMENGLEATFLSAGFTASELLTLPWSLAAKIRLAAHFEEKGAGDKLTHQLILSSREDLGYPWAKMVLSKISALDAKQRSIGFYGKNSRTQFQSRLNAIGKLAQETKSLLPGASAPVRVYLIQALEVAYRDLDQEILSTPLPEGLDEQQLGDIKIALEALALPLRNEANSYQALLSEQVIQLGDKSNLWMESVKGGNDSFLAKVKEETSLFSSKPQSGMSKEEIATAIKSLSLNPDEKKSLQLLRNHFQSLGEIVPAAYFTGRLSELETNL
jgi:hypothetical protein